MYKDNIIDICTIMMKHGYTADNDDRTSWSKGELSIRYDPDMDEANIFITVNCNTKKLPVEDLVAFCEVARKFAMLS